MSETQQKQKVWYDQTVWMRELRPNYQVVVLLPTTHNKLLTKWQGLYTVIHRTRKVTYEVDMPESRSRRKIFHINLLKKWYESEETACMARDTEAEEDVDDIPSWKENIDSKITINGKLSTKQKEQLEVLLQKYQDVLKGKPGKTNAIKYFIHTTDSSPVKQHPYCLPHAYWEEVRQELKAMLADGVIEPSQSDWALPIVLFERRMALYACVLTTGS